MSFVHPKPDHQDGDEPQGNILKPYVGAHCARMFLVSFDAHQPEKNRAWLRSLVPNVTFASSDVAKQPVLLNVGLSHRGLQLLGVDSLELDAFPEVFKQGMLARAAYLGDAVPRNKATVDLKNGAGACPRPDVASPATAEFGQLPPDGFFSREWHAVVIAHIMLAPDAEGANPSDRRVIEALQTLGAATRALSQEKHCTSANQALNSEVEDVRRRVKELVDARLMASGTFVMNRPPAGMTVQWQDLHTPLDEDARALEYFGFRDGVSQPKVFENEQPIDSECRHFVLGAPAPILQAYGSYLVVRKLAQNASKFWAAMHQGADPHPELTAQELAERVVGRRMNGARLDGKDASGNPLEALAAFDHDASDAACPFHSHVRRLNPRSTGLAPNPRLIRRGMSYADDGPGSSYGLMFMAYNTNIEEQFEFMQRNWVQRGNHAGLRSCDVDGVAGVSTADPAEAGGSSHNFTTRFRGREVSLSLTPAITYRGGGYFFVPSRAALRRIDSIAAKHAAGAVDDAIGVRLNACKHDTDKLTLVQAWIDKPDTGTAFWRHVETKPHQALEIGGIWFIANPDLCKEVLHDDGARFSVQEYGRRMRSTFGSFMLGMDQPAHDLEYRANQIIPSANLHGHFNMPKQLACLLSVQETAREATKVLMQRALQVATLQNKAAELKVLDLMGFVLGKVAAEYFGMTELSAGALLNWSALIAKRHFRFQTDTFDEQNARAASNQLRAHVSTLIASARERQHDRSSDDTAESKQHRKLLALLGDLQDALARPAGRDVAGGASVSVTDHDLARNLIGITLGSMVASAKAVAEAISLHAADALRNRGDGRVWQSGATAHDLHEATDPTGANSLYERLIAGRLRSARRGSLDSVYRVYRGPQPFKHSGLEIAAGATVVVWLGGATEIEGVDSLFGAGIHKCPGMDMAKAIINGVLQALVTRVLHSDDDGVTLRLGAEDSLEPDSRGQEEPSFLLGMAGHQPPAEC